MWILKSAFRHRRSNLLLLLTVAIISVLFGVSASIRENSAEKMKAFLDSYEIKAYYSYIDQLPVTKGWLWPKAAELPVKYEDMFRYYSAYREGPVSAKSAESDTEITVTFRGVADLPSLKRPEIDKCDLNGYSNNDFKFDTEEYIAIVSKTVAEDLKLSPGKEILMWDSRERSAEKPVTYKVCGIFDDEGLNDEFKSDVIVPISLTKEIFLLKQNYFYENPSGAFSLVTDYDYCYYVLKDASVVRDFKAAMSQERTFKLFRLIVDDDELTDTLKPIRTTMDYMDSALYALLVISLLMAFIVSFILLKNRNAEIAIMMCIGSSKLKIFLALLAELVLTTAFAIVAGASAGYMISVGFFGETGIAGISLRLLLLLTAFTVGAAVSLISSLSLRAMDILTRKEG